MIEETQILEEAFPAEHTDRKEKVNGVGLSILSTGLQLMAMLVFIASLLGAIVVYAWLNPSGHRRAAVFAAGFLAGSLILAFCLYVFGSSCERRRRIASRIGQ